MKTNPLLAIKALGQHVWLDNLSRSLLEEGTLQSLITDDGIDGVTSNPSIFQKVIASSPYYRADVERLRDTPLAAEVRYEALVIPDVQAACDMLWPSFVASRGDAGYVSLEVSPALAHDVAGTVAAARRLQEAVGRDNLLIKVPATPAGIIAFEQLTATGMSVNVTLIFSLDQYEAVAQAYLRGAHAWWRGGKNMRQLRSVASVFLSRVDTLIDQRLAALDRPAALALKGKAGLALAKCCYRRYLEIFHGADFAQLRAAGIRPQSLLWASTGTKNPASSDVFFVEPLIGRETITTLPDATLAAFRTHGQVAETLLIGIEQALAVKQQLAEQGIDLAEIGSTLQHEGVLLFAQAYTELLGSV